MKTTRRSGSAVPLPASSTAAPLGSTRFLAVALWLGAWSLGCGTSGGTGGSGNSGGTVAVQGTGGSPFDGGGTPDGGGGTPPASGGSSPAGISGHSSGGNPGSGGNSGGAAGAITPTGTGGTGNGGATPHGGNGGGGPKGGSAGQGSGIAGHGVGGKGAGGNGSAGGGNGASGGASGGHGGGSAVAGHGGAGGGSTGGAGGAVSTASLLVELGNAFCGAARTCCAAKSIPATLSDCEAQFPARLWGLSYVNKGTVTIDNAALAACIAGYKQTSSTCAFQPLEAACKGVFVGTKADGVACGQGGVPSTTGSIECKGTGRATQCLWTGDSNMTTTTGVCQSPARGKKGDPCATTCRKNESCVFDLFTAPGEPTATCLEDDGLYCSNATGQPVCATIVPTGGSCAAESTACASTDYCDGTGATPKCRKAATLGQACSSSGPNCASGMSLFCGTGNKCEDLGFAYETTCGGTPPFPI